MGQTAGKYLIIGGIVIAVLGILVYFLGNRINFLGKLPGDIRIERNGSGFYFPITTCLLISAIITVIVQLVQWFSNQ